MVVKTLQVFYGADRLPYKDKERKIHFPIVGPAFQGSSQVNEIKFYIGDIGSTLLKWIAVAKLPNGRSGMKLLDFAEDEDGAYVTLSLTRWFTQCSGDLYISLRGYDNGCEITYDEDTGLYTITGEPVIQSTGSIKLKIEYATPIDDSDYGDITIQELIGFINTKLDKDADKYFKVVTSISDINGADYADYLKSGDRVISKADDTIYSLSGTYPSLTYTKICDLGDLDTLSGNQTITGYKTIDNNMFFTYGSALRFGNSSASSTSNYTEIGTAYAEFNDASNGFVNKLKIESDGNWSFVITKYDADSELDITTTLLIPYEDGTIATQAWTTSQIGSALSSVYKAKGSKTVAQLNGATKTSDMNGYVYNVSDSGILVNSDNTGISVRAGDNVAFVWNSDNSWKWDNFGSYIDLSGYVDTSSNQAIGGNKSFDGNVSFTFISSSLTPSVGGSLDAGSATYYWYQIFVAHTITEDFTKRTDATKSYTFDESMAQFNPTTSGTTTIKWTQLLTFSLSMNTTFTLETSKTNCKNEYKAIITNSNSSSITLTFTGVSQILCNDDNITTTNATNSTLVLPTNTTIEISIIDGRMVAINFAAE